MVWNVRTLLADLWHRLVARRPSAPVEPVRAIQFALRRLRRLSAGGVPVPKEISATILTAKAAVEANHGVLPPEIGVGFYEACQKLALLAARVSDQDDEPLADPFARAALNSELMLKCAAENGTLVPPEVQRDLIAGQLGSDGPVTDPETRVKFYVAYATLARSLGNVTADTIKACRSVTTWHTLKRNETRALAWALVTAAISVLLFTSSAIDQQMNDEITTANDLAIKLRGNVFPPVPPGGQAVVVPQQYTHEPCNSLTATPVPGDFVVRTQADLDQLQSFTIAVRGARTRANKLNAFIASSECDPFGLCWWWNGAHNRDIRQKLAPGATPSIRERFELNPAIENYTAEFLCKVETWQEVRDFATNVQKSYEATSGGIVAHALPILYALLGAYAYRLRQFSETVRNRTYHPSFADSARLITALIAGTVAGLFNPAKDLAVSPLATAFLVGYGVEIFFKFLDTSLTAYGGGGGAPAPSSTPPPSVELPPPPAPVPVAGGAGVPAKAV